MIEAIKKPLSEVRSRFEICYKDETHIGWMNSYHINGNKKMLAVGIDIPNRNYRGKGLGESALQLYNKTIIILLYEEVNHFGSNFNC